MKSLFFARNYLFKSFLLIAFLCSNHKLSFGQNIINETAISAGIESFTQFCFDCACNVTIQRVVVPNIYTVPTDPTDPLGDEYCLDFDLISPDDYPPSTTFQIVDPYDPAIGLEIQNCASEPFDAAIFNMDPNTGVLTIQISAAIVGAAYDLAVQITEPPNTTTVHENIFRINITNSAPPSLGAITVSGVPASPVAGVPFEITLSTNGSQGRLDWTLNNTTTSTVNFLSQRDYQILTVGLPSNQHEARYQIIPNGTGSQTIDFTATNCEGNTNNQSVTLSVPFTISPDIAIIPVSSLTDVEGSDSELVGTVGLAFPSNSDETDGAHFIIQNPEAGENYDFEFDVSVPGFNPPSNLDIVEESDIRGRISGTLAGAVSPGTYPVRISAAPSSAGAAVPDVINATIIVNDVECPITGNTMVVFVQPQLAAGALNSGVICGKIQNAANWLNGVTMLDDADPARIQPFVYDHDDSNSGIQPVPLALGLSPGFPYFTQTNCDINQLKTGSPVSPLVFSPGSSGSPGQIRTSLVGEVLSQLHYPAGGASILDDFSPEHIILVVEGGDDCHYATYGELAYRLINPADNTEQTDLSFRVSVHFTGNDPEGNDDWEDFAHGLARQLEMKDLFLHPSFIVSEENTPLNTLNDRLPFGRGLMIPVEQPDDAPPATSESPFGKIHPTVYNKEFAAHNWITDALTSAGISPIAYINSNGFLSDNYIRLRPHNMVRSNSDIDVNGGEKVAIVIGLTEGVADINSENNFIIIEARRQLLESSISDPETFFQINEDPNGDDVIVYQASRVISNGQAPVLRIISQTALEVNNSPTYVVGQQPDAGTPGLELRAFNPSNVAQLAGEDPALTSFLNNNRGFVVQVRYRSNDNGLVPDMAIRENGCCSTRDVGILTPADFDPSDFDNAIAIPEGGDNFLSDDLPTTTYYQFYEPDPVSGFNDNSTNRIAARVRNIGTGEAEDIRVEFKVSYPTHGFPGYDYETIGVRHISSLLPNRYMNIFIPYNPSQIADAFGFALNDQGWPIDPETGLPFPEFSHSCARINIYQAGVLATWTTTDINFGSGTEVNISNNSAQRNLNADPSETNSPYTTSELEFSVGNPYDSSIVVFFRPSGIPANWRYEFEDEVVILDAGENYTGRISVTPPDDYPICNNVEILIKAYTPEGHTITELGENTLRVATVARTEIDLEANAERCNRAEIDRIYDRALKTWNEIRINNIDNLKYNGKIYCDSSYIFYNVNNNDQLLGYLIGDVLNGNKEGFAERCAQVYTNGCTNPPRPNAPIVLKIQDEDGNPVYINTTTDANGCYSNVYTALEGGNYNLKVLYEGENCTGDALDQEAVEVPGENDPDIDKDGLPDRDEIAGWDDDGDGILNQFDRDSDNDGVLDGRESKGNLDNDSRDDVIDPDRDGGGIVDGADRDPDNPEEENTNEGPTNPPINLDWGLLVTLPKGGFDDRYNQGFGFEVKTNLFCNFFGRNLFNTDDYFDRLSYCIALEGGLYNFKDSFDEDKPYNIWGAALGPKINYGLFRLPRSLGGAYVNAYGDWNIGGYFPSDTDGKIKRGTNWGFGLSTSFRRFYIDFGYSNFTVNHNDIKYDAIGFAIGFN